MAFGTFANSTSGSFLKPYLRQQVLVPLVTVACLLALAAVAGLYVYNKHQWVQDRLSSFLEPRYARLAGLKAGTEALAAASARAHELEALYTHGADQDANQIGNDEVFHGDFSEFILGMWGGLELNADPFNSPANMARLRHSAAQLENGRASAHDRSRQRAAPQSRGPGASGCARPRRGGRRRRRSIRRPAGGRPAARRDSTA